VVWLDTGVSASEFGTAVAVSVVIVVVMDSGFV
jgi:hypothetical protein